MKFGSGDCNKFASIRLHRKLKRLFLETLHQSNTSHDINSDEFDGILVAKATLVKFFYGITTFVVNRIDQVYSMQIYGFTN